MSTCEAQPAADPSQTEFASALLDPELPAPHGLKAWNGSDPAVRLGVYRNNVISSLVDALADTCPVVQRLVGEEFFRAMAAAFVRKSPPRSRVLAHYGREFPSFIAAFEPARMLPYLADVARLEVARVQAYHAADAVPVGQEHIAAALAAGDRIAELRLGLQHALFTLESAYSVVTLWAAHQGGDDVPTIDVDAPEAAVILRAGLDVLVLRAPAGATVFIEAVRAGCRLGEAAEKASAAAVDAFDLPATLSMLVAHGALTHLELPAPHGGTCSR